jgi:hypothetical protein
MREIVEQQNKRIEKSRLRYSEGLSKFLGLDAIARDNASEREVPKKEEWSPPQGILTLEQCEEVIRKIDLSGFPYNPEIKIEHYNGFLYKPTTYYLQLKCIVNDRETGFPIPLYNGSYFPVDVTTHDVLMLKIRSAMLALCEHELDEFFIFNGKRIFDPHDPKTRMLHGR